MLEIAAAKWRLSYEIGDVFEVHRAVLYLAQTLDQDRPESVRIASAAARYFREVGSDTMATKALLCLAQCLFRDKQLNKCIDVYTEIVPTLTGVDSREVKHRCLYVQSLLFRGTRADLREAESQCRRALVEARRLGDADLFSMAQEFLAIVLSQNFDDPKRVRESLELFEEVVADKRRVYGRDHVDTLTIEINVAHALHCLGRTAEAVALYQDLLRRRTSNLAPQHNIMRSLADLGQRLDSPRRVRQCVEHLRDHREARGADSLEWTQTDK